MIIFINIFAVRYAASQFKLIANFWKNIHTVDDKCK